MPRPHRQLDHLWLYAIGLSDVIARVYHQLTINKEDLVNQVQPRFQQRLKQQIERVLASYPAGQAAQAIADAICENADQDTATKIYMTLV